MYNNFHLKHSKKNNGTQPGYAAIANTVKSLVISGKLSHGSRIPTRRELVRRFGTTPVTVQRAMNLLRQQGFLRSDGRNGTFVTSHPPHACRFALAFCVPPWDTTSRFYKAIAAEAEKIRQPHRNVVPYYRLNERGEDYRKLLDDTASRTIAGIIFTFPLFVLSDTPLVKLHLPMLVIQSPTSESKLPQVYPETAALLDRSFQRLSREGRRKPAIITLANDGAKEHVIAECAGLCRKHGLLMRPDWVQGVSANAVSWASQTVLALFGPGHNDVADSLVITDDGLVPPVTKALSEMKMKIPGDLEVIAHANFPWPTKAHVPCCRIGYDIRDLVEQCVMLIEEQRHGMPPRSRLIAARFADELPPGKIGKES